MFTVILWIAIIVAIVLAFKRLARGLTVFCIFVAMIFFAVFMLDSVTTFPIRDYLSLKWYDDTIEDPKGKIENVTEVVVDGGKKAVDTINETGHRVDVKYGNEHNKEWVEDKDKKPEETESSKDTTEEESKKREKVKTSEREMDVTGETMFVPYSEVDSVLTNELKDLSKDDKQIIESMTSIYKTKINGTKMDVWNNKEKGDYGVYIKLK